MRSLREHDGTSEPAVPDAPPGREPDPAVAWYQLEPNEILANLRVSGRLVHQRATPGDGHRVRVSRLGELTEQDKRKGRVVELHFFAGVGCTGTILETRAASPLLASTGQGGHVAHRGPTAGQALRGPP